jgi:hybrid cluster-associated redox disulfide protein
MTKAAIETRMVAPKKARKRANRGAELITGAAIDGRAAPRHARPVPKKKEEAPPLFTLDDLLADVVDRHPGAKDVLLSFGLPCFKCVVAESETLRQGCAPLRLDAENVLARLNALPPQAS